MTDAQTTITRKPDGSDEQRPMETSEHAVAEPPTGDIGAPTTPTRGGSLHLVGRILSWILVAAASIVAVSLLAVTIGPKFFPYQALVVRSGSMSPTIKTGSIVFYEKVNADKVKVGDIIVFDKPGQTNEKVTHRVFKISNGSTGRYFTTKGDANGAPDSWRVPAVGTGWVSAFHIPAIGYALAALQSTLARLLLLVIPALALGAITLYEIWRERGREA
ncbi:MAG: signal peptidase [Actinomycetia bacterium]|nr:signal peptidase [Actinomycetes bacterium]